MATGANRGANGAGWLLEEKWERRRGQLSKTQHTSNSGRGGERERGRERDYMYQLTWQVRVCKRRMGISGEGEDRRQETGWRIEEGDGRMC